MCIYWGIFTIDINIKLYAPSVMHCIDITYVFIMYCNYNNFRVERHLYHFGTTHPDPPGIQERRHHRPNFPIDSADPSTISAVHSDG